MAHIRTIKPEFFTSEDIVERSPLARILYVGLWCEADREGRMVWKPKTFKIRYLPADDCDIESLCNELVDAGLVELYGDGYAHIPAFLSHQHINARESQSTLPKPQHKAQKGTRSARVDDALNTCDPPVINATRTCMGEGKGREGVETRNASARGTRLPADWKPSETELRWARDARPDLDASVEGERFADYWHGVAGSKGVKLDWPATWRNWIRGAHMPRPGGAIPSTAGTPRQRRELGT